MTDDDWFVAIVAASNEGVRLIKNANEMNRACDHIADLLRDAVTLYKLGSPRAAFLAITAIEETAKVHVGMFRRGTDLKRSKDPLFKHGEKHRLAAGPTVAMGERLNNAIGEPRVHELIEAARRGAFITLRESSLYLESDGGSVRLPSDTITQGSARELVLMAIEVFDDALVGHTNRSHEIAKMTDELFSEVAAT